MGAARYTEFMSRLPISPVVLSNACGCSSGELLTPPTTRPPPAAGRCGPSWCRYGGGADVGDRASGTSARHAARPMRTPVLPTDALHFHCGATVGDGQIELALSPSGRVVAVSRRRPRRRRSESDRRRGEPGCSPDHNPSRAAGGRQRCWSRPSGPPTASPTSKRSWASPPSLLTERLQTFGGDIRVCWARFRPTDRARRLPAVGQGRRAGRHAGDHTAVLGAEGGSPHRTARPCWFATRDCGSLLGAELACDRCGEALRARSTSRRRKQLESEDLAGVLLVRRIVGA